VIFLPPSWHYCPALEEPKGSVEWFMNELKRFKLDGFSSQYSPQTSNHVIWEVKGEEATKAAYFLMWNKPPDTTQIIIVNGFEFGEGEPDV
jgi:hypothetical protein